MLCSEPSNKRLLDLHLAAIIPQPAAIHQQSLITARITLRHFWAQLGIGSEGLSARNWGSTRLMALLNLISPTRRKLG